MRSNLSPNVSLDFLDGYIFHVLQQIAAESGLDESGLTSYYGSRLKEHIGGLIEYEIGLAKLLLERCKGRRIVHAGIGVGTLTCALACNGFRIAGVESYGNRVATAKRMRSTFAQVWPEVEERYEIVQGYYPQALDPSWCGPDVTVIFTNVGAGWDEDTTNAVIASLARFGEAYLDLRLFGRVRAEEDDRVALFSRIEATARKGDRIPGITANFHLARFEFA
jgi:hypothetical protein